MDLREQRYVCTLAEYGNLTRAAEKLYISQPALSLYIANLEKSLGLSLFDRSGKKFCLTYAGERYVEKAKQMLDLEREFSEEVYALVNETLGRLCLGISQRRGSWLIPPVAARYEELCPEIDLVIKEGNLSMLNEMLRQNELDLIVLNKSDVQGEMETISLFEEEFLAAVPVRHPINENAEYVPGERYRKLRPEALNGQNLILHTPFQSSRNIEDTLLERHHVRPGNVRIMRSMETCIQMVAEGLGIGFIREGYAIHLKYTKPVNYYMLDTEHHKRELVVAYRKGWQPPKYAQTMIELLVEQGRHFLEP